MSENIAAGGNAPPVALLPESLLRRGVRLISQAAMCGGLAAGGWYGAQAHSIYEDLNDTPGKAVGILEDSGLNKIDQNLGPDEVDPGAIFQAISDYETANGINPLIDFTDKTRGLAEETTESASELSRTLVLAGTGTAVGLAVAPAAYFSRKRRVLGLKDRLAENLKRTDWRRGLRYAGALTVAGSAYINPTVSQAAEHVDKIATHATADLRRSDPTGQGKRIEDWLVDRMISRTSARVVDEVPNLARLLNIDSADLRSIIYAQMESGGDIVGLPISTDIAPGAFAGGGVETHVTALELNFKTRSDSLKTPLSIVGGAAGVGLLFLARRKKISKAY